VPITLEPSDRVAICGDSITEQKQYSVFIEQYLLACQPKAQLRAMQFGWGGETVWGFATRVKNDVLGFSPTVATTCYGMNDGGYGPLKPEVAQKYRDTTKALIATLKEGGVRAVVIGSPGVVDSTTYKRPGGAEIYNKTLGELRDIAREVATEAGVGFADVHGAMLESMTKFKAKYPDKPFAGGDGVHPGANGHLAMAYAFLKALGADGDIGTITVDLAGNKAEATEGHKVLSAANGTVEIESTRYPFVFSGKAEDSQSPRAAAEFVPFNDDLNRFRLVVNGVNGKAKVTWGTASKEFSADDLAKGINLAAEFPDNPFAQPFAMVEAVVRKQQEFETPAVKKLINSSPEYHRLLPDQTEAVDALVKAAKDRAAVLNDASAASVTPVAHTIKIEAVQ
jgi:lysophospholipase L1-like esterase